MSSSPEALAAHPLVAWTDDEAEALRNAIAASDRLIEEAFDEIERLRVELVGKSRELGTRERELAAQRQDHERASELAEQLRVLTQSQAEERRALEHRTSEWESRCKALELTQQRLSLELAAERTKTGELALLAVERDQMREQLARRERDFVTHATTLEEAQRERDALQAQWAGERSQLHEKMAKFDEVRTECAGLQEQLKAAHLELRKLTQQVTDREDLVTAEWRARTEGIEQERDTLRSQLEQVHAEAGRAERLSRELEELRQQLSTAEQSRQAGSATRERQIADLEQERAELEAELELVRGRAVELQETVDRQQHELAASRNDSNDELKLLRLMAEQQALLIAGARAAAQTSLPSTPAAADEQTNQNDAVVQSVMAQFAKLQKGVAERRRKQTNREA